MELQEVTIGYRELQGVIKDHKGYRGLQRVTGG